MKIDAIIQQLRFYAEQDKDIINPDVSINTFAADALEAQQAEIERLTKQRDELEMLLNEQSLAANKWASAYTKTAKQRDELNRLCEFNEATMQGLVDTVQFIVNEVKLTSSQYELCRQAIASVKGTD